MSLGVGEGGVVSFLSEKEKKKREGGSAARTASDMCITARCYFKDSPLFCFSFGRRGKT